MPGGGGVGPGDPAPEDDGAVAVGPGIAKTVGVDSKGAVPELSLRVSADCPIFRRRVTFLFLPGCSATAPESSLGCWPAYKSFASTKSLPISLKVFR